MAEHNVIIKHRNGGLWEDIYPSTKAELVDVGAMKLSQVIDEINTNIGTKVDKVTGKGLSPEEFTTDEKTKLAGIATGANNYTHPTTAGNKHIPSGGATGDLLGYSGSSGTASWRKLNEADIPALSLAKIADAGTAASRNAGNASGNVPILNAQGKLDDSVIPNIAISDTFVVASQTAMLALTVEVGDIAVRTDLNKTFILKDTPASVLANWQELLNPTSPVQSVAGKTGAVTLIKGDVGLGSVENYGIASKAEAETGSSNVKYMTPLRVKEAIISLAPSLSHTHSATEIELMIASTTATNVSDGLENAFFEIQQHAMSNVNPHNVTKAQVGLGSVENYGIASKAEAEAGTATNKYMTPQRTKEAIQELGTKIVVSITEPANADIWYKII